MTVAMLLTSIFLLGGNRSSCWEPGFCGDGTIDFGEECDFGYTGGDCDGCVDCKWHENVCGDGYQCDREQCDDGNSEDVDGCSSTCELEHDMILVPAGSFVMSDPYMEEHYLHPQHPVTLTRDFYMDRSEVTNRRYCYVVQWAYNQGFVDATHFTVTDPVSGVELLSLEDYSCEIDFLSHTFTVENGRDDYPMLQINWYGAVSYCNWLSMMEGLSPLYDHTDWLCSIYGMEGYRLPTEAEWEFAAQYDDERTYPWGDDEPTCDHANYNNCIGYTDRVCRYPLGYSSLGFCDMAGNVAEWTSDWWAEYTTDVQINPTGPDSGTERVWRDSGWYGLERSIRCSYRFKNLPESGMWNLGFRGVKIGGSPSKLRRVK